MKLTILGKLLAVLQILVAIWYFDWNSWNHVIVSFLLFISGVVTLIAGSRSRRLMGIKHALQIVGLVTVVFLLIKLLFVG